MISKNTEEMAQALVTAWTRSRQAPATPVPEGMPLDDGTLDVVSEALLWGNFDQALALAAPELRRIDPQAPQEIQREAERLACRDAWLPETEQDLPRPGFGQECLLMAVPCSGTAGEMAQWLTQDDQRARLLGAVRAHLARLLNLPADRVLQLEALPGLTHPEAVASLSANSRRRLLHEMLRDGLPPPEPAAWPAGAISGVLRGNTVPLARTFRLNEGVWLVAARVETRWDSSEEDADDRLYDLAMGMLDEHVVEQTESLWDQALAELPTLPVLAFVPQPLSVNAALIRTLQAHLLSARLQGVPHDSLLENLRDNALHLARVVRLSHHRDPQGNVVLLAETEDKALPTVKVSFPWAMIEGPQAFEEVLAEAFGLEPQPSPVPVESVPAAVMPTAAGVDPRAWEGDHPAWGRAMKAPSRLQ